METQLRKPDGYDGLRNAVRNFESTANVLPAVKKFTKIEEIPEAEKQIKELVTRTNEVKDRRSAITQKFDDLKSRLMEPEKKHLELVASCKTELLGIKKLKEEADNKARMVQQEKASIISKHGENCLAYNTACQEVFIKAAEYWDQNELAVEAMVDLALKKLDSIQFVQVENKYNEKFANTKEQIYERFKKEIDTYFKSTPGGSKLGATVADNKSAHKVMVNTAIQAAEVATAEVSIVNTKALKYNHTPKPITEAKEVLNVLNEYMVHFEAANNKLSVRSWGNLKLSQIAAALCKLQDDGVKVVIESTKEARL